MIKLKPIIVSKLGVSNSDIKLDTSEWLEFLGTHSTFTYSSGFDDDHCQMNLVKRKNSKWYANKKIYSSSHSKVVPVSLYIGADNQCTREKLESTLWHFSQDWAKFWHWYYSDERKATPKKGCTPPKSTPVVDGSKKGREEVERLRADRDNLLIRIAELQDRMHSELKSGFSEKDKRIAELDNANWEIQKRYDTLNELYRQSERKRTELQDEIAQLKALAEGRGKDRDSIANLLAAERNKHTTQMQDALDAIAKLKTGDTTGESDYTAARCYSAGQIALEVVEEVIHDKNWRTSIERHRQDPKTSVRYWALVKLLDELRGY